jgi:hypothetical protein
MGISRYFENIGYLVSTRRAPWSLFKKAKIE